MGIAQLAPPLAYSADKPHTHLMGSGSKHIGINPSETAIHIARNLSLARSYVDTAYAVAVSRYREDIGDDTNLLYPTFMLFAHATELYLKS